MKCDELRTLLDPFIDQELPENAAESVAEHLASCPGCQHEADAL